MPERIFRFKQFSVVHSKSAMKVGTDAVLLGAWASIPNDGEILDIGSGCGIISLMLAKRSEVNITALDVDCHACEEAKFNVEQSPWPNRISVVCGNISEYARETRYSLIVCNPPYFSETMQSPNPRRVLARHSVLLTPEILFESVNRLLADRGYFSMIYPADKEKQIVEAALKMQLHVARHCDVYATAGGVKIRVLLEFSRSKMPVEKTRLVIEDEKRHNFNRQYKNLTKEFYLNF